MSDDLRVGDDLVIPEHELEWRFSTSGGPGGQHANRSATRAEVAFDLGRSPSVPDGTRQRMLHRLGRKARGGVVVVEVSDTRSQWRNRAIARQRLAGLLGDAMRTTKRRRPTRAGAAVRRRRIESKKRRSETKRLRKRPEVD